MIEVLPSEYISFKNKIKTENFKIINSDIPFLPTNNVLITNEEFILVSKLIESLEELDDVQEVYTNFDLGDIELETILK